MTIPARSWSNMFEPGIVDAVTRLTIGVTEPGDAEVQLCIDGPDDVCLDRKGVAELIADLQARLALINGEPPPLRPLTRGRGRDIMGAWT